MFRSRNLFNFLSTGENDYEAGNPAHINDVAEILSYFINRSGFCYSESGQLVLSSICDLATSLQVRFLAYGQFEAIADVIAKLSYIPRIEEDMEQLKDDMIFW